MDEPEQLGHLLEGSAHGGPGQDDAEMGPRTRLFVFVLFTQLGQALMSYDGGATQMSTQPLLANGWTSSELGLLGAMDKFGQVATAFVWSHLLTKYDTKLLLVVGLFTKAASCLGFGILERKWLMLSSKLGMGVSEALIGVWATVWVQANAPKDSQARWLGLASISAGLGNGAGSAVAGLCSARLGYAFAFVLQAAVLFGLWAIMLATPGRCFEFEEKRRDEELPRVLPGRSALQDATGRANGQEHESQPLSSQTLSSQTLSSPLRRLRRSNSQNSELMLRTTIADFMSKNDGRHRSFLEVAIPEETTFLDSLWVVLASRLWLFTALSISLSCFITSSVSYLWQNTMASARTSICCVLAEDVWGFNDTEATCSFLFTTGVGGLMGVVLGPKIFDEYLEGFATASGIARCLRWCTYVTLGSAALSTLCAFLFLDTAWRLVSTEESHLVRDGLLICLLTSISLVFLLVNSMQGTFYGINTDSTTPETKTSAAGLTVSMQNIVGFAFGPLLPSIATDLAKSAIRGAFPAQGEAAVQGAGFASGMAVALGASYLLLFSVRMASLEAGRACAAQWRGPRNPPRWLEGEACSSRRASTLELRLGPL